MTRRILATGAFVLGLWLAACPVRAQSSIDNLFPVPNFPFTDPAVVPQNLWMTQNGVDYRATITQLGYILQQNCATIQGPFTNQLCWDTTTTPATLKTFQGNVWAPFPNTSAFAPINSPNFTGIPTAPTAAVGTNTNQIATTAFVAASQRKVVTGPSQTLYVDTNGTDLNNDCTSQTNPCATIQNAANIFTNNYDMHGNTAIIQLCPLTVPCTFGTGAQFKGGLIGQQGAPTFLVIGNPGAPDNVVIAASGDAFLISQYARVSLAGMKITSATGSDIWARTYGHVIFSSIDFGQAGVEHIRASEHGTAEASGAYIISGSALSHWRALDLGLVCGFLCDTEGGFTPVAVTLLNTPAFANCFARSSNTSDIRVEATIFAGTAATGCRYLVNTTSTIDSNGGGPNFLPGSIAGTADATTYGAYR